MEKKNQKEIPKQEINQADKSYCLKADCLKFKLDVDPREPCRSLFSSLKSHRSSY